MLKRTSSAPAAFRHSCGFFDLPRVSIVHLSAFSQLNFVNGAEHTLAVVRFRCAKMFKSIVRVDLTDFAATAKFVNTRRRTCVVSHIYLSPKLQINFRRPFSWKLYSAYRIVTNYRNDNLQTNFRRIDFFIKIIFIVNCYKLSKW